MRICRTDPKRIKRGGFDMIKDIMAANESVTPNAKEIAVLREHFPACFAADGSFDIERFKEYLSDKVAVTNEGYELRFLGKNYARLLASLDTTTVIVPDEQHNSKQENANSQNIYISGDNLDGLKQLLKSYAKKIRCIYIDPPYNTGTDGFTYTDNFNFTTEQLADTLSISDEQANRILDLTKRGSASHSAWLMFMYPRLLLARDLLTDDGVIFISIDDNEHNNLKLLCDDVFGEENFIDSIVWEKKSSAKGVPPHSMMVNVHEYVVAYHRNGAFRFVGEKRDEADFKNPDNDPRGPWRESNIKSTTKSADEAFTIVDPNTGKEYTNTWAFSRESLEQMIKEGRILWKESLPKQKEYMYEMTNENKAIKSFWGVFDAQSTTVFLKDLLPEVHFDNPKPINFMKYLLSVATQKDDIILDFFGGSSTTAHAVMQLNVEDGDEGKRRFIIVQLQEQVKNDASAVQAGYDTIDKIGIARIIGSADIIRSENPTTICDLGFRHFTLLEPSVETLDKLKAFEPESGFLLKNTVMQDFGVPTVLATWLVRDGYGFTAPVQTVDFDGYIGYYMDKHLYLINPDLKNEAIAAITAKYEADGAFNPENVVLCGYSFTWTETESLKVNLARLKDTEKNLRINFEIRY